MSRFAASAHPVAVVALSVLTLACSAPSNQAGWGSGQAGTVGEHGAEGVGFGDPDRATDVAAIDEIMMAPVREGRIAGASVAVVHGGEPVAIRGYGWANLSLGVPTPEDAIYEMGSVTKQFTSAGLLRMQEEGKVDLDADMADYLPDFPTQGNRITVRELLDHTSGMRGYTEIAHAYPYFVRRVPRDSLLAIVAEHPFDFATGEHSIYNNSAFFLAGMILEDASGMSYEDYVEERIFAELGMHRSHYCSETEVHEGKVNGYDMSPEDGLVNKGFIVHNVPYAAGSLCASAGDLATWLAALHGGEVLNDDSYAQLIEPGDLNDGTRLRYALGIAVSDILGHRAIHHGGGINGFLSESLYLPDEDLSVVVLVNTVGPVGPSALAREIVTHLVGDATPEPMPFEGDLAYFEGVYGGPARAGEAVARIEADGDVLTATMIMMADAEIPPDQQSPDTLHYRGGTTFVAGDMHVTFEAAGGSGAGGSGAGADGAGESAGDGSADGEPATGAQATVLRWDAVMGYTIMRRR